MSKQFTDRDLEQEVMAALEKLISVGYSEALVCDVLGERAQDFYRSTWMTTDLYRHVLKTIVAPNIQWKTSTWSFSQLGKLVEIGKAV
jgi:hypothetical protein